MLQRLYVHNFKCLENFELATKGIPSALLIGENGTGKSTVANALEVLQGIGRGMNRVGKMVRRQDFGFGRTDLPMRFEIEVLLGGRQCVYIIAFELTEEFKEPRVAEEKLIVDGAPIYTRKEAQVTLHATADLIKAQFLVDRHLVALPIIQDKSAKDPLHLFKTWLARTVILAPIPALMTGDSDCESLEPKRDASNLGEWYSGLLNDSPAAYTQIEKYLQDVMPDIKDFVNPLFGNDFRRMIVRFEKNAAELEVHFADLSDGEKCFFLCAVVLAANPFYGPLLCFWDEPDNYLSLSEVGHFVTALRRAFVNGGQLLATSHNPEAIREFSDDNTFVLDRKSHLEPTIIRRLSDIAVTGDLVDALIRGDVRL
ncbi:MAG: AAA family ATPase [Pseudomonadota bacterium]